MDPYDNGWRVDFYKSVEYHNRRLRKSRRLRASLIRDYAGSYYTEGLEGTSRSKQPISLMRQAAQAHMLALAGGEIRFGITATKASLGPFAKHFSTALNNLAKEIHLSETIQELVLDGFFGLAVAKIFLADAPMVEIEADVWMDPGQPYLGRVPPGDFLFDTDATDFRRATFSADRYRIPYYLLEEDSGNRFDPEAVAEVHPTSRRNINIDSDEARAIAFGEETDEGEFEPHIELCDVYFPREQLIATWAMSGGEWSFQNTPPLTVTEWDGAETGPYEMLNLGPVPDSVIPSSPAENSKIIFDLINSAWRKMNNQSKRQKDILLAMTGHEQDAQNVINCPDGGVISVTDPEALKPVSLGGVNPANLQFAQIADQVADKMAGNITAKLGLGPSSETASQDEMIQTATAATQKALQEKVVRFVSRIGKHLAWLLFDDPAKVIPGTVRISGTPYEYDSTWRPDHREGTFDQYEYRVEPFSLPYKSPSERAQILDMVVQKMVPLMPMMQQQGIQFDFARYLERQAELLDSPHILEIFKVGPPQHGEGPSHQAGAGQQPPGQQPPSGGGGGGQQAAQQQQLAQLAQQQAGPQIQ